MTSREKSGFRILDRRKESYRTNKTSTVTGTPPLGVLISVIWKRFLALTVVECARPLANFLLDFASKTFVGRLQKS